VPTESKALPENKPAGKKASKKVSIRELLKPHLGSLSLGLLGVIGEGVANLLEPWPLKLVLDDVLRGRESHAGVMRWIHEVVGTDKLAMLKFACAAVIVIEAQVFVVGGHRFSPSSRCPQGSDQDHRDQ